MRMGTQELLIILLIMSAVSWYIIFTKLWDQRRLKQGAKVVENSGYEFFIRGVGNTTANIGEEGANAIYVDGVYMGHKWQCVELARRFGS